MDPWTSIRRAASDRRSGSLEVAARAATGLAALSSRRDRVRAARMLVRAHPAMGLIWRLAATALDDGDVERFVDLAAGEADVAADAARWLVTRRASHVVTHSASGTVAAALERARGRIASVTCTVSLPGGEGRPFARRLEREGFIVDVVPDAALATACASAHVALVGADAICESGVVNKVGTRLVALAARDAGIACYAMGTTTKMVPSTSVARGLGEVFELTPLELFDAVVTDRGPLRPASVRRAVARVRIDPAVERLAG